MWPLRWAVTPWFRQRAQVGERLTAFLGISSVPGGALVSPPVAESEAQGWTVGISLASMDLEAGVEGQGGHKGPLLTSPPVPGKPHLKGFPRHPSVDSAFTPLPSFLPPSPQCLPWAPSFPEGSPSSPAPLSSFPSYVFFEPNIVLSCWPVLSRAQVPCSYPCTHRPPKGLYTPLPPTPCSDRFSCHPLQQPPTFPPAFLSNSYNYGYAPRPIRSVMYLLQVNVPFAPL